MGAQHSAILPGLLPSPSLKWKEGPKMETIPFPGMSSTLSMDKLVKSAEFKNFVLKHLDSELLVKSILSSNIKDDTLCCDVLAFKNENIEATEKVGENMDLFEKITRAGVKISLEDFIGINNGELNIRFGVDSTPYFRSFQRRLVLLANASQFVIYERRVAQDVKKSREYQSTVLNSTQQPLVFVLDGLNEFSLSILRMYPTMLQAMTTSNEQLTLCEPLERICISFNAIGEYGLFHSWAPLRRPPLSEVCLKAKSVASSTGKARDAVDGKQLTCWTSTKPRASWSVQLETPDVLHSIKISWIPSYSTPNAPVSANSNGAPRKLTIAVTYRDPVSNKTAVKSFAFDPENEFKKQSSWNQNYPIITTSPVVSVKITVSKCAHSNQSGSVKMYNFQALKRNVAAKIIDGLMLLKDTHSALLSLVSFPSIDLIALDSALAVVRASGSLGIFLAFVQKCQSALVSEKLKLPRPRDAVLKFLTTLHVQDAKAKTRLCCETCGDVENTVFAVFDQNHKSSAMTITEQGTIICGTIEDVALYGLVTCVMSEGTWIWEMCLTEEDMGDETVCLGVATRPVTNEDYEKSPDLWTVRCVNGDLFHVNQQLGRKVCAIHPKDICRFTYDCEKLTLSLAVNDNDQGIIFEMVPVGISPVVCMYGEAKKVKIISMKHKPKPLDLNKQFDINIAGPPPSDDSVLSSPCVVATMLAKVATTCQSLFQYFQYREKKHKSRNLRLEYPNCVEVSMEVIESLVGQLTCALENWHKDKPEYWAGVIRSLLTILDCQLSCLKHTEIDVSEVGFLYYTSTDNEKTISYPPGRSTNVINEASDILNKLMKISVEEIRAAAVSVFSHGASLFLPNIESKIDLANQIIGESFSNGCIEPIMMLQLAMTVEHVTSCEFVLQMLNLFKYKLSFRDKLTRFLDGVLHIVSMWEIDNITGKSSDPLILKYFGENYSIKILLSLFQEQLFYDFLTPTTEMPGSLEPLMLHFCKSLLRCTLRVVAEVSRRRSPYSEFVLDNRIREGVLTSITMPMMHMLCMCCENMSFISSLLPEVILLLKDLTVCVNQSVWCKDIQELLMASSSKRVWKLSDLQSQSSSPSGWREISVRFEEPEGGQGYSVLGEGMIYTSTHSSNTCAVLTTSFSGNTLAAWEFCLESDATGDECSVFGAARMPLTNRCYSSSSDLWMRRSYNGQLYNLGQAVGISPSGNIHPGDTVRIEFDGKQQTLSYSVNGSPMEVAFTGIIDPVFPSCGSYRTNVSIKLLKVEVFGDDNQPGDTAPGYDTINWCSANQLRESSLLKAPVVKDVLLGSADWISCRGDHGAASCVHEWAFDVLEVESTRPGFVFGAIAGRTLNSSSIHLAGPAKLKVSTPTADCSIVAKIEDVDISVNAAEQAGMSDTLVNKIPEERSEWNTNMEFGWKSDGSLWANGQQVFENFGKSFLPLQSMSTVSIRINREDCTISYFVNGSFVGIAFGPEASGASASIPLPQMQSILNAEIGVVYPAVSLLSINQTVGIKCGGCWGSLVSPIQFSLQKTAISVVGRLSAALVAGSGVVDKNEAAVVPWLQSPLFIGGFEDSDVLPICDHRTWSQALHLAVDNWPTDKTTCDSELSINPAQSSPLEMSLLSEVNESQNLLVALAASGDISSQVADEQVVTVMEYLENIEPEQARLRQMLEQTGGFSFPICERAYIACLLKHSGLIREVQTILKFKIAGTQLPVPSSELVSLWRRVKQLRSYLRNKRQSFKGSIDSPISPNIDNNVDAAVSLDWALPDGEEGTPLPEEPDDDSDETESKSDKGKIVWREMDPSVESRYNAVYFSTIQAVGIDFSKEVLILRFTVVGDNSLGALQSPADSKVKIGEIFLDNPEVTYLQNEPVRISGNLCFDYSALKLEALYGVDHLEYRYGTNGYSYATFKLPTMPDLTTTAKSAIPSNFEELCRRISEKSRFLLKISPSKDLAEEEAGSGNAGLANLMTKFSNSDSNKSAKGRSQDGQDRWKRVIDFLRTHSKLRQQHLDSAQNSPRGLEKQNSFKDKFPDVLYSLEDADRPAQDSLEQSPIDKSLESLTINQATMQACSIFITSEDNTIDPKLFADVIACRTARARYRSFGLCAIKSALDIEGIDGDPFAVNEILLFLRSALCDSSKNVAANGTKLKEKSDSSTKANERVHYLANLEGCSSHVLSTVQSNFAELFQRLLAVASLCSRVWEDHEQNLLHVESSSAASVVSKPLPNLSHHMLNPLALILGACNLRYSNRDHDFVTHCGLLPMLYKLSSLASLEESAQKWKLAAVNLFRFQLHHRKIKYNTSKWYPMKNVSKRLLDGSLAIREVLFHVCSLQSTSDLGGLNDQEVETLSLKSDFHELCGKYGFSEALLKHETVKLISVQKVVEAETAEKCAINIVENTRAANQKVLDEIIGKLGVVSSIDIPSNVTLTMGGLHVKIANNATGNAQCILGDFEYEITQDPRVARGNYFEVTVPVLTTKDFGVGFANKDTFDCQGNMPGWTEHSYGYHGDDGAKFGENKTPGTWPLFNAGDVIGCGFCYDSCSIFYTRNGDYLGLAFTNVCETKLSPCVGYTNRGRNVTEAQFNFGMNDFVYKGPEVLFNPHVAEQKALLEVAKSLQADVKQDAMETCGSKMTQLKCDASEPCEEFTMSQLEYESLLGDLQSNFHSCSCQLAEFSELRKCANAMIRQLLVIACTGESFSKKSSNDKVDEHDLIAAPQLMRGISMFGTPNTVTSNDSQLLREHLLGIVFQELMIGSTYLSVVAKSALDSNAMECPAPINANITISALQSIQHDDHVMGSKSNSEFSEAVLEPLEVEAVLFHHMLTLLTILPNSVTVKDTLSSSKALQILFLLLEYGSTRLKQVTLEILIICLPNCFPESVEGAVLAEWKSVGSVNEINNYDTSNSRRKSRKFPDSFVKYLFYSISSAALKKHVNNMVGYGECQLAIREQCVSLIHELFKSSLWTEILSCSVTDSIRAASMLLQSDIPVNSMSSADFELLELTSAIVSSFVQGGILRNGCVANDSNRNACKVIEVDWTTHTAQIVPVCSDRSFETVSKLVITVPISSILYEWRCIDVDFNRLSQPLISQLIGLMKLVIEKTATCACPNNFTRGFSVMSSLNMVSTLAVSLMFDKYVGVFVDGLHEAAVLESMLKQALTLTGLPISCLDVDALTAQLNCALAINLQTSSNVPLGAPALSPCNYEDLVDQVNLPQIQVDESNENMIVISHKERQANAAAVNQLSRDLGLDEATCMQYLESFKCDVSAANQQLQAVVNSKCLRAITESSDKVPTPIQPGLILSDDNILKFVDTGIVPENAFVPNSQLTEVSIYCISHVARSNITVGNTLLVDSHLDGEVANAGCIAGVYLHDHSSNTALDCDDIVLGYYEQSLGVLSVQTAQFSKLKALTYRNNFENGACIAQLEMALAIIRMRHMISKSISSSNGVLVPCMSSCNILEFMKLTCSAELSRPIQSPKDSSVRNLMSTLCTSNPLLPACIADDVLQSLDGLANSLMSKYSSNVSLSSQMTPLVVGSPHPLPSLFSQNVRIDIDEDWKGVLIVFDPRCSFGLSAATLKLYDSLEHMTKDEPILTITNDTKKDLLQPLAIPNITSLYYKFETPQSSRYSNKLMIPCRSANAMTLVSAISGAVSCQPACDTSDSMTGNIFNDGSEPVEENSVDSKDVASAVLDVHGIRSGLWFYEVTISEANKSMKCLKGQIGWIADDSKSILLSSDGDVSMSGSVVHHDDAVSTWKNGDIIGCVLEINGDEAKVCFAKNGQWLSFIKLELSTVSVSSEPNGLKPYLVTSRGTTLTPNFGSKEFVHCTTMEDFKVPLDQLPLSSDAMEKLSKSRWGFEFTVKPLKSCAIHVCRHFENIWTAKPDDIAKGSAVFSIWRPAPLDNAFGSVGDVISLSSLPPVGVVTVMKLESKNPVSFARVFSSSLMNMTIWRPIPPEGYVSLGDIVIGDTKTSQPSSRLVWCVPSVAVETCDIKESSCIMSNKRGGEASRPFSISIWGAGKDLQTFFGSPGLSRCAEKSDVSEITGIGQPYRLAVDSSVLNGEWMCESDILTHPSMSWAMQVCDSMLELNCIQPIGFLKLLFSRLVLLLRSTNTPNPLRIIPMLIKVIRTANIDHSELPLHELDGLCRVIFAAASGKIQKDKYVLVNEVLVNLMDLVIEAQSAVLRKKTYLESDASVGTAIEGTIDTSSIVLDITIARAIKPDMVESVIEKRSQVLLFRHLRRAIKYFTEVDLKQRLESDSSACPVTPVHLSSPALCASLWYDHFSTALLVESEHPYSSSRITRAFTIPGADKLSIVFDQRFAIGAHTKLTITPMCSTKLSPVVLFGNETNTSTVVKSGVSFVGCTEVLIEFEVILLDDVSDASINPAGDWGWALAIYASGAVYESATIIEELSSNIDALPLVEDTKFYTEISPEEVSVPVKRLPSSEVSSDGIAGCTLTASPYDMSFEVDMESDDEEVGADVLAVQKGLQETGKCVCMNFVRGLCPLSAEECKQSHDPEDMQAWHDSLEAATTAAPKTSAAGSEVQATDESSTVQLPVDDKILSKEEFVLRHISTQGRLCKSGIISVAHATSMDIVIERPHPLRTEDSECGQVTRVISLSHSTKEDPDVPKILRLLVPSASNPDALKCKFKCSSVSYVITAMLSSEVIKAFDALHGAPELEEKDAVVDAVGACDSISNQVELPCLVDVSLPIHVVPPSESVREEFPPALWSCDVCTLLNSISSVACEMCTTARPGQDSSAAPAGETVGWWCAACTFISPLSSSSCAICTTARAGVAASTAAAATTTSTSKEPDTPSPVSPTSSAESVECQIPSTLVPKDKDVVIIHAKGHMLVRNKFESRLEACLTAQHQFGRKVALTPFDIMSKFADWKLSADDGLLEYINAQKADTSGSSSMWSSMWSVTLPKQYIMYRGAKLAGYSVMDIQARMLLFQDLNKCLEDVLPVINLSSTDPQSLGSMVRRNSRYLFMKLKQPMLDKAIQATNTPSGAGVPVALSLDNSKALTSRDSKQRDPNTSQCCFVQAFKQLEKKDANVFRHVFSGDRVFNITFVGESGIDAGGVYREGMSRIVEDLFSDSFDLLLLCPNGQHSVHVNMDKFIPNPQYSSNPTALKMFEFMGRLMSTSIRVKACLPFELPSLVWKKLTGEEVCLDDLMEVDAITCRLVEALSHCEGDGIVDEPTFVEKYGERLKFVCNGSDGMERELLKGEGSRPVTFANRLEYCKAVVDFRLNEFNLQVAAIARGMNEVIPMRVLQLFSWQQLEILVAGSPTFDMEVWKAHTDSSGISPSCASLFWQVMTSLTAKEQSGFVRFAWGRSRLPAAKDFTTKMRLTMQSSSGSQLPEAHTCFFTVDLPDYKTEEDMRHGLLIAINYGVGGILMG